MHAILVTLFLPRLCRVIYNHGDNKYSSLGAIGLRGWFMHVLEIKPCRLCSRIRDVEAERRLKVITDLTSW